MKIKRIDNIQAIQFLKDNHARREVVFIRQCDVWYGAFINDDLVGVGGYVDKGKYVTFGGLFINEKYRNKGIATSINQVRINDNLGKKVVVYARPIQANILTQKFGFKEKQHFKNGTIKVERILKNE